MRVYSQDRVEWGAFKIVDIPPGNRYNLCGLNGCSDGFSVQDIQPPKRGIQCEKVRKIEQLHRMEIFMNQTFTEPDTNQKLRGDMHLHTLHSDGCLTPGELIKTACENGIQLLSITDHDTVAGIEEGIATARKFNCLFIPGVELEVFAKDFDNNYCSIHLLGYGMNYRDTTLLDYLKTVRKARVVRAKKMLRRLHQFGIEMNFAAIKQQAGGELIGRVHVARALKQAHHVRYFDEAFELYIGDQRPAYVAKPRHSPEKIISLIHSCGGIAVWAHPFFTGNDSVLEELIEQGLDGIECYHHEFDRKTVEHYRQLASHHDLLITGGSDFHGTLEEEFKPGDWWYEADSFQTVEKLLETVAV